jgi:hypothetical protein
MLIIVEVAFFVKFIYRDFIVSPITAAVSHIKPVPTGTYRDSSITQDNDKTNTLDIRVSCICPATGP